MKELTIEQKAEAYDKALKQIKECTPDENGFVTIYPSEIFPELKKPNDEEIKKTIIRLIEHNIKDGFSSYDSIEYSDMIAWLRKQEQSKKISIWKHWKDGIAGNGEGKPVFLIKNGSSYSLSSCLSFECDYIELSELSNLMLENQNKQNTNILWHDISEKPEEHRELFCEWEGYGDNVWHDVAFYHSNETFWNGEQQIENVVRWAYVDDIIEKQSQTYIVPKFRVGDWITNGACTWKIDSIEDNMYYNNHCGIDCGGDIKSIDGQYHFWTIKDAKDGDILVTESGKPFIFKGCLDKIHPINPVAYGGICSDGDFHISTSYRNNRWTDEKVYPATKEQNNLLFQKITDLGYEWDTNKKKLHKFIKE